MNGLASCKTPDERGSVNPRRWPAEFTRCIYVSSMIDRPKASMRVRPLRLHVAEVSQLFFPVSQAQTCSKTAHSKSSRLAEPPI
jgi:hypothetical protein